MVLAYGTELARGADSYVGRADGAQGPEAIWLELVRFVRLAQFLAGKTVIFLKNPVITGG